jgi:hypothetical protein
LIKVAAYVVEEPFSRDVPLNNWKGGAADKLARFNFSPISTTAMQI